jgi:hypothetical protein
MRELEVQLARIRNAGNIQLNYDMWDRWGAQHASAEEKVRMEAEFAAANRASDAAKVALQALVAQTRTEAPHEIAAWADAHRAYLTAFLEDCQAQGKADSTEAFVARQEITQWGEVAAGTRTFVDENVFYVTMHRERYQALFGIEPDTLASV